MRRQSATQQSVARGWPAPPGWRWMPVAVSATNASPRSRQHRRRAVGGALWGALSRAHAAPDGGVDLGALRGRRVMAARARGVRRRARSALEPRPTAQCLRPRGGPLAHGRARGSSRLCERATSRRAAAALIVVFFGSRGACDPAPWGTTTRVDCRGAAWAAWFRTSSWLRYREGGPGSRLLRRLLGWALVASLRLPPYGGAALYRPRSTRLGYASSSAAGIRRLGRPPPPRSAALSEVRRSPHAGRRYGGVSLSPSRSPPRALDRDYGARASGAPRLCGRARHRRLHACLVLGARRPSDGDHVSGPRGLLARARISRTHAASQPSRADRRVDEVLASFGAVSAARSDHRAPPSCAGFSRMTSAAAPRCMVRSRPRRRGTRRSNQPLRWWRSRPHRLTNAVRSSARQKSPRVERLRGLGALVPSLTRLLSTPARTQRPPDRAEPRPPQSLVRAPPHRGHLLDHDLPSSRSSTLSPRPRPPGPLAQRVLVTRRGRPINPTCVQPWPARAERGSLPLPHLHPRVELADRRDGGFTLATRRRQAADHARRRAPGSSAGGRGGIPSHPGSADPRARVGLLGGAEPDTSVPQEAAVIHWVTWSRATQGADWRFSAKSFAFRRGR